MAQTTPFDITALPQELQDVIYNYAITCYDVLAITAKQPMYLIGYQSEERIKSRTNFPVFSTHLFMRSKKTRASYLAAAQSHLIKQQQHVCVFIDDCDFTPMYYHSSTALLPASPPSLPAFDKICNRIIKSGGRLNSMHHIPEIADIPAVAEFLQSNRHYEVANAQATSSELGKIFYAYKFASIAMPSPVFVPQPWTPTPAEEPMIGARYGVNAGSGKLAWVDERGRVEDATEDDEINFDGEAEEEEEEDDDDEE
ncbi:hypothetical protein Slin15195_G028250 [Septoria linicola]|uniref:Uncharacterized protein n=1 Tax=Septoria linicola TaxID=215465 RepID=A0A9Q9AP38_9PEZI|nr:hypothetical protein Slin15195_G028250 [Septoria linicola]